MDSLALARVLHVLAVVVWIGGVSIVTTALLPAVRRGEFSADWLAAFQAIERRFVWQARIAIIVVGLTGLYMIVQADCHGSREPMSARATRVSYSGDGELPLGRRFGSETP